jgi:hypothetical protein
MRDNWTKIVQYLIKYKERWERAHKKRWRKRWKEGEWRRWVTKKLNLIDNSCI